MLLFGLRSPDRRCLDGVCVVFWAAVRTIARLRQKERSFPPDS